MRGVIVDIGGVLVRDGLLDTAERWAARLGLTRDDLLAAVYGGNDETVLIGRLPEDAWWDVVASRLRCDTAALRTDLESGQVWDDDLVSVLRSVKLRARTAILSNAWPSQRARMDALGLLDAVHDVLLSCDIGAAKPNPEAFRIALGRLGTAPADTLLVDDTPGHVEAASALGIRGHVHLDRDSTTRAIEAFLG